jgi:hypothetical protein
MRQTRLHIAVFALLALALAVTATASNHPATPLSTSPTCSAWLFDGCCGADHQEEQQRRTCIINGLSVVEVRCVATECV